LLARAWVVRVDGRAAGLGDGAVHGLRPRRRGCLDGSLARLQGDAAGSVGRSARRRVRLRRAVRHLTARSARHRRRRARPDGGRVRDRRRSGVGGPRDGGGRAAHVARGGRRSARGPPRLPALARLLPDRDDGSRREPVRPRLHILGCGAPRAWLPRRPARRLRRHGLASTAGAGRGQGGSCAGADRADAGVAAELRRACA
jgi:hypothetical protein